MSVFSLRDKKVVLNTNMLLIPELKAIVEAYPKDYINVLSFVNFMTNPIKEENPYLEVRESDKTTILRRDFPGKYDEHTPLVRAAMTRMVEEFIDLPEDRMYAAAKIASEGVESALKTIKVDTLNDVKTMMDIFQKMEKAMESLSKTRVARDTARTTSKTMGNVKRAYDQ